MAQLPLHFFTIVLNGDPFMRYHIEVFKQLDIPWHWHIIEGVAELAHDTAWSVHTGGRIPSELHNNGLSQDGTTEYIDELKALYPENISVYRKPPGVFWEGKREMVNAPLSSIHTKALLWQLDSDELWTKEQIEKTHKLFLEKPEKTAAWFWCWYFVTPDLVLSTKNCYAQDPKTDWLRVWRFEPGCHWASHEPPCLNSPLGQDLGKVNPMNHVETEKEGLLFQHYSYVTKEQLRFKEIYYGYTGAVQQWEALKKVEQFPVAIREYFSWVNDTALAEPIGRLSCEPIATQRADNTWEFAGVENAKSQQEVNLKSALQDQVEKVVAVEQQLQDIGEGKKIVIDAVFFQLYQNGIARVWDNLLREWSKTSFANNLVVLDRKKTAPRYPGIVYRDIEEFAWGAMRHQQEMLERICLEEKADLFLSTYYTSTVSTPCLQMVYDMVPEVMGLDLNEAQWVEKHIAFQNASAFVSISENTRKDLHKYFPEAAQKSSTVCHLASDAKQFYPASPEEIVRFHDTYGIKYPYFLMVGAAPGYKNGKMLFRALQSLSTQYGFGVVLAGGSLDEAALSDIGVGVEVYRIQPSDDELRAAYTGAVALVYPSQYEGFGLPVLEAMSCQCPVVTTPHSSLPEVAGDAALYINTEQELVDALCEVQKPSVQAKLRRAGHFQAQRFSWEKTARNFEEQIIQALQSKKDNQRCQSLTL